MARRPVWTLTTAKYGKTARVKVNRCIPDIAVFKDKPGFPYLLMAANPEMALSDVEDVLRHFGNGQERSRTWLRRRSWLFRDRGRTVLSALLQQARPLMERHPNASAVELAWRLRKVGIAVTAAWVKRHRVTSD